MVEQYKYRSREQLSKIGQTNAEKKDNANLPD